MLDFISKSTNERMSTALESGFTFVIRFLLQFYKIFGRMFL